METALKFALLDNNYTFLARELLNYFEIEDFLTISGEIKQYYLRVAYTPHHGFRLEILGQEEDDSIAIPSDLLNEYVEETTMENYEEIHEDEELSNDFLSEFMFHLDDCYPCKEMFIRVKSQLVNKIPDLLSEYAIEIAEQAEIILNDTNNYISEISIGDLQLLDKAVKIRLTIETVRFDELVDEEDFDSIYDQIPEIITIRLPQILQEESRKLSTIEAGLSNYIEITWNSRVLGILYHFMNVSLQEIEAYIENKVIVSNEDDYNSNNKLENIFNELSIFSFK